MGLESLIEQAEKHFAIGDLNSAELFLNEAYQENPGNKEVLNNLGVMAFMRMELQLAEKYFKLALKQDQRCLDTIFNLAEVFRYQNKIIELRPYLEPLIIKHLKNHRLKALLEETGIAKSRSSPVHSHATTDVHISPEVGNSLKRMKILHAPFEIAANMGIITRSLRKAGLRADSANYYDSWLKYNCDYNLHINRLPPGRQEAAIDAFAGRAKAEYDIFHFHFLQSLYPDLRDLAELKDRGKKICFSFWGSDHRAPEWIYYQQARFLGHKPPKPYFFNMQLYLAHKKINQFADVLFGQTIIPRGIHICGYSETDLWTLEEKQRILNKKLMEKDPGKTYFLHAPSSNWKKGSSIIMNLLAECKSDGLPIEVIYVSGKTPDEARNLYAYADYAIDQVGVGRYGFFGVEMMCWEIPVLVHQIPLFDKIIGNPPVIKILKANFKEKIKECVDWKKNGKRNQLGRESREWAIRNADISRMLPVYLKVYNDLAEGRSVPQLVNTSWFREEEKLQKGEKSQFYRYMLENKVFDQIGITTPTYDKRLYW